MKTDSIPDNTTTTVQHPFQPIPGLRFRRDGVGFVPEDVGPAAERDPNDSDDAALEPFGAAMHRRPGHLFEPFHDL